MWTDADRRLGAIIETTKRLEREKEKEKTYQKSEQHFKLTLEKLWPSKSKEHQN